MHDPRAGALLVLILAAPPAPGQARPAPSAEPPPPVPACVEAPDLDPDERALVGHVDVERAAEAVRALVALGPRMGGTPSGDAAAEHLAATLRSAGLAVEVVEDPPAWSHAEERWSVALAVPGEEPAVLASAWPLGFSPAARGEAPLALEPAAGVALLAARTPRWLARGERAADGTPAVVLLDGRTTPDGSHAPVFDLPREAPCPAFVLNRPDGERVRAALATAREAGGRPAPAVRFALETRVARTRPRTVVARLPARGGDASADGGEPPAGFFLVCAHGDADSGGPGANDNASGEAIVLEMAAAWASAVAGGAAPPPAREVRFAIWGKEFHSSRAFLERTRAAGEELLGVLNFDQSGYGAAGDRLHVEPDDLAANEGLVRAALGVLRDAGGRDGFPARWVTNRSLGGTDSYVFSDDETLRSRGRPAVTLYASAWDRPREVPRTPGMPGESWNDADVVHVDHDPWYHSTGDTPENTTDRQPWHLGWGARVGLLAVKRYLEGLE